MSNTTKTHDAPPWPGPTEASPWYTVDEAAAYLRVSADLIRRTLKYQIAHRQNGKRAPLYFHRVDLDRWAAAQTVQPVK